MNETALTISEQGQLSELEVIIDKGLNTFYEVGKALSLIREGRLYRASHATFEEYCEKRWEMSRAYAYRTIGAADVVESLSPIGDIPLPRNEAQARPLTSLEPEQRQEAWQKAVEESSGHPTAKQVQLAADEVTGKGLSGMIQANVNAAAYESIHSLQTAVLDFFQRVATSNADTIKCLEDMKENRNSGHWHVVSLDLARKGKVFRVNDLRQAVNNALDSARWAASQRAGVKDKPVPTEPVQEAAQNSPSLVDSVEGFILTYKDPWERHWAQIPNPSHTNGTFWRAVKSAFTRDGITYKNDAELKIAIKRAFALLKNEPEPDTRYWEQFAEEEEEEPIDQGEHWAKSNPMAFWLEVDRLGVSRARALEFLQPGAKYVSELNMTQEEAFAKLADAPRRVDAYNPTRTVEPVAAAPVLNREQEEAPAYYGPCAHCGRELTGPGWTSDLGGNVCDVCASEHSRHAQTSQGQVFATLPDPPPSDMMMATNSLRVNIESIPVNVRQELAQEFRWWSDDDKKQLINLTGIKRDVCSARSVLLVTIANLLEGGLK